MNAKIIPYESRDDLLEYSELTYRSSVLEENIADDLRIIADLESIPGYHKHTEMLRAQNEGLEKELIKLKEQIILMRRKNPKLNEWICDMFSDTDYSIEIGGRK